MDFKNTGLAKSTPRGTVWVAVGPDGVHICDVIVLSANRNGFQVTRRLGRLIRLQQMSALFDSDK